MTEPAGASSFLRTPACCHGMRGTLCFGGRATPALLLSIGQRSTPQTSLLQVSQPVHSSDQLAAGTHGAAHRDAAFPKSRFVFDVVPSAFVGDSNAEALGAQFRGHGGDKAGKHSSYMIYSHIIQSLGLNRSLRVLEIGLGTKDPEILSTMTFEHPNAISPFLQPGSPIEW
jgi:hypothetical protein